MPVCVDAHHPLIDEYRVNKFKDLFTDNLSRIIE